MPKRENIADMRRTWGTAANCASSFWSMMIQVEK